MYVLINTDDYDNISFTSCIDIENNFDIIIPTLILTTPCGLSFLSLMSLLTYTIFKPLKTDK